MSSTGERFFSAGWAAGWALTAANAGEGPGEDYRPGGFTGITELFGLGKPIVGAVNGSPDVGGAELMVAAHLVVSADSAKFSFPEHRLSVLPNTNGLNRLGARLPQPSALEPSRCSQAGSWEPGTHTARELAASICESAPRSVAATLDAFRHHNEPPNCCEGRSRYRCHLRVPRFCEKAPERLARRLEAIASFNRGPIANALKAVRARPTDEAPRGGSPKLSRGHSVNLNLGWQGLRNLLRKFHQLVPCLSAQAMPSEVAGLDAVHVGVGKCKPIHLDRGDLPTRNRPP